MDWRPGRSLTGHGNFSNSITTHYSLWFKLPWQLSRVFRCSNAFSLSIDLVCIETLWRLELTWFTGRPKCGWTLEERAMTIKTYGRVGCGIHTTVPFALKLESKLLVLGDGFEVWFSILINSFLVRLKISVFLFVCLNLFLCLSDGYWGFRVDPSYLFLVKLDFKLFSFGHFKLFLEHFYLISDTTKFLLFF